jgi:hypothetical protein
MVFLKVPSTRGFSGSTSDLLVNTASRLAYQKQNTIANFINPNSAWTKPLVGAAIAGIALAITAWVARRGPKQKIQTTHIVDEAEPFLIQNLNAYLGGPRTLSNQAVGLQNFDAIWARVVAECSQAQYGEPGERCVNDRKEGSTKGYDWFKMYRTPIANDPTVVADPGAFSSSLPPLNTGGAISPEVLIGVALVGLAMAIK